MRKLEQAMLEADDEVEARFPITMRMVRALSRCEDEARMDCGITILTLATVELEMLPVMLAVFELERRENSRQMAIEAGIPERLARCREALQDRPAPPVSDQDYESLLHLTVAEMSDEDAATMIEVLS
jgi:hypothetical protein